ncbi:MAG: peptidoglycan-binding domain-containing protein, partial [Minisyncoccia bacterium]
MKKYKLFSFVFALALLFALSGFGVKSASAANCASGDLFSSVTGQACSATTATTACAPGDLFSSLTGQACSGNTPTNNSAVAQFNSLFKSNFQVGLKGSSDVSALQQFLKDQGYYAGNVDGSYGRITARAVSDFEGDNNIGNMITTIPPTTCMQRPACLDSQPSCMIAEPAGGWCPTTSSSTITVLSPNNGDSWTVGTTQTIRWVPPAGISNVAISLKNN